MEITSTEYHDKVAKEYDDGYKEPYWQIYNEVTWSYIKECLPKDKENSKILDAGGGTGLWSIKLAKEGFKVILTDVSEGMLKVAREKIKHEGLDNKVTIINSDITNLKEFEDESFELTLAEGDPVSYCNDPKKAITELSRVTKSNGYVTVSVDNKLNWASSFISKGKFDIADKALNESIGVMPLKPGEFNGDGYTAHMFTIEELSDLFRSNNLEPVKSVGKPVFIRNPDCLKDEKIFQKYLEFEIEYSSLPSVAGRGGHIALIGRKQ